MVKKAFAAVLMIPELAGFARTKIRYYAISTHRTLMKKLSLCISMISFIFMSIFIIFPSFSSAAPFDTWRLIADGSGWQNDFLYGVAYGNSEFIAVGNFGTIVYPTDSSGNSWIKAINADTHHLYGIAYRSGGPFVAVGSVGTILTSPDGRSNWTIRTSGTGSYLQGVTYGNGTFVAVGSSGRIIKSPDGVTWTTRSSGTSYYLEGVTYGNGTFVAVGDSGTILTSANSMNWTKRTSGITDCLIGVTYGNGMFVVVGKNGRILTSPDGVTWNIRTSGTTEILYGVTYGNGYFVAVGSNNAVLTSPDGIIWTSGTLGTTDDLYAVIYDGSGIFVAVGSYGKIFASDVITGSSLTVTPFAGANGNIDPSTPQTVNYNGTASFTVTPNTGYQIASVTGCGGSLSGNTYTTGPITDDCALIATFIINTYTISASAGPNGSINPSAGVSVNYGANQSFSITPGTNYHVLDVQVDGSSVGAVTGYTFNNIMANHAIAATFARSDTMPPTGSIGINSGALYTNITSVTLNLSASDPSGVSQMCISNSTSCAAWESFTSSKAWTLSSGDGLKTVYVWYQDGFGNADTAPYIASITLDTTAPVLSVSTLSDGSWTNNNILNVAGAVTDNTGVQQLTINGQVVTVNFDNIFSYPVKLLDGANTISVIATDFAGNQSTDTRTVNLDQKAPVITITAPADNMATKQNPIDITGTVDNQFGDQSTVNVSVNGATPVAAVMNGTNFSLSVALAYGINTIEVTATDLAGNTSTAKRTITFDDQNPSLSITYPSQDIETNQANMTITGTVSDITAVTVTVTIDSNIYTPVVTNGQFEQPVTFTTEKTYQIYVTATNEVGNQTTMQRNIVYDITQPAVTIDPVTSPTKLSSQVLTGTMEEGATVNVTCPTATVGAVTYPTATTWTVSLSNMEEGSNAITVTAADDAGNVSNNSTATIVVDTTPSEPPTLIVTPQKLDYTFRMGDPEPASQAVNIEISNGPATWTATSDSSWLSISPASLTGNTYTLAAVNVHPVNLSAGTYKGNITIDAPGALGSPANVEVNLEVKCAGIINANCNISASSFTILGPVKYEGAGQTWSAYEVPDGQYTITYNPVMGYKTPQTETKTISGGNLINFEGNYTSFAMTANIIASRAADTDNPPSVGIFDASGKMFFSFVPFSLGKYRSSKDINLYGKSGVNTAVGDIDGDGKADIVVGLAAGSSNPARVAAYMADGTLIPGSDFIAMSTKYGANVAVADFDGDGNAEIVVGAGLYSKNPAQVRIFKYESGEIIDTGINFIAHTVKGGVNIATGDIDGDGIPELITGAGAISNAKPEVRVWKIDTSGGLGHWSIIDTGVRFTAFDKKYGASVATGDINGDGIDEIIVGSGPDPKGNHNVIKVFNGYGTDFGLEITDSSVAYGLSVASADLNGDGIAEIIAGLGTSPNNPATVNIYQADGTLTGTFDAFEGKHFGVMVSVGDLGY